MSKVTYKTQTDKNAIDSLRDAIIDGTCETVKCPKALLTEPPKDIDPQKQKAYARAIGKLLYPQTHESRTLDPLKAHLPKKPTYRF